MSSTVRQFCRTAMPFVAATLLLSIPFHLRPDNFCVDDGYFYPQIARNIVQGHRVTFKGWLPTNGFHPLWMMFCCLCAWVSTGSDVLLQLVAAMQDVLLAVSVTIVVRLAWRDGLRGTVFGCVILWATNDLMGIWRLLETDLALLLQLLVLLMVVHVPSPRSMLRYNLGLGALLGLTLLARLDLLFFAVVILCFAALDRCRPGTVAQRIAWLLIQGGTLTAVLLPYLAWNLSHFGHLMPISGAIKNVFPHLQPRIFPLLLFPATFPVEIGTLFGIAMLLKHKRNRFETVLMLTGLAGGVHLLYSTAFSTAWPWYFTTGYLAFGLAAIWTADRMLKPIRFAAQIETGALAIVAVAFLLLSSVRAVTNASFTRFTHNTAVGRTSGYVEPRRAFAELLRSHYAPGTRFFIF